MNEVRFVTILAAAIAGWIVIMWLTLSAMNAAQQGDGGRADTAAPAATVDVPALPPAGTDYHGAGLTPCATLSVAPLCARAASIA